MAQDHFQTTPDPPNSHERPKIRLGPDYNGRGKCMKTNGNRLGVLGKAWRPRMGWLVRLLSRSRMTGNAIHGHPDAHVCMFDGKYQSVVV